MRLTKVVTSDLSRARNRARGEDGAGLTDVDDGGARYRRRAVSERHAVEVDKGNKASTRGKVLHNPLGVVLAEHVSLRRERVSDGLASGGVFESDGASLDGSRIRGHHDGVAGRDGEAVECIGVIRVPLVPRVKGDSSPSGVEVDSSLQDGGGACVSLYSFSAARDPTVLILLTSMPTQADAAYFLMLLPPLGTEGVGTTCYSCQINNSLPRDLHLSPILLTIVPTTLSRPVLIFTAPDQLVE